jgi:hypothetical protein
MSLDRDDEYAFRKREVEALEAIGKAASIIVQEHEERQNERKQFDDGIREAGGELAELPPARRLRRARSRRRRPGRRAPK